MSSSSWMTYHKWVLSNSLSTGCRIAHGVHIPITTLALIHINFSSVSHVQARVKPPHLILDQLNKVLFSLFLLISKFIGKSLCQVVRFSLGITLQSFIKVSSQLPKEYMIYLRLNHHITKDSQVFFPKVWIINQLKSSSEIQKWRNTFIYIPKIKGSMHIVKPLKVVLTWLLKSHPKSFSNELGMINLWKWSIYSFWLILTHKHLMCKHFSYLSNV